MDHPGSAKIGEYSTLFSRILRYFPQKVVFSEPAFHGVFRVFADFPDNVSQIMPVRCVNHGSAKVSRLLADPGVFTLGTDNLLPESQELS